jgi:hypothetical protein
MDTGFISMNSKERFNETMDYGTPDRVPYFEEGIREEVITKWEQQGWNPKIELTREFPTDRREEIILDLEYHPSKYGWPRSDDDLNEFCARLDPLESSRLPPQWDKQVEGWRNRDHVLMMRVHEGLFQTLGINEWTRFEEVMFLFTDRPGFVQDYMQIYSQFAARLVDNVLNSVQIDAAIFSEPIGGNHGALVSPKMYEEFALKNYLPVLEVLCRHGVRWMIVRTYANAKVLIPAMLKYGLNCLWACEVDLESMDYQTLRNEFGRDLRLIGGIDLDCLRGDVSEIRKEIEAKVPPLLADGGYIPLADGRVRADIPYEKYLYYRNLVSKIIRG